MIILKGRILDVKNGTCAENGAVVIEDNRVTRVCPEEALEAPPGAEVYALKNGTVMPGMIDAHVHLALGIPEKVPSKPVYTAGISRTIPGMEDFLGYRILKAYLSALTLVQSGITTGARHRGKGRVFRPVAEKPPRLLRH